MSKSFYITTAIPYVNAAPHIGFAMELLQADAIARYHRELLGDKTLLLSGADENALKNVQAAQTVNLPIQEFVDKNSILFIDLARELNATVDVFQKGSNQKTHFPSSQKLWELCSKNGDIYQKEYEGLYCVGCETFYAADELSEEGECFEHPGKKLETVREMNYFFRLSNYQDRLKKLIESDTLAIYPQTRKNEVLSFLKEPLQDISISRTNERAKNWGVPVPGDDSQRMYVWFDALNIYQSGVGYGWDEQTYKQWWPANVHLIGKGIIRFHAVYWPAFLMSAGLALPQNLVVHGYITVDGQKMSKTIGNVIDPFALVKQYGQDAIRYYLLREIPTFGDGDFSRSRFQELYNADLANGIGNLTARITTLGKGDSFHISQPTVDATFARHMCKYELNQALAHLWTHVASLDKYINDSEPWKITDAAKKHEVLQEAVSKLHTIAFHLQPFMPKTSASIIEGLSAHPMKKVSGLFPRLT